jgi:hypothetical protein
MFAKNCLVSKQLGSAISFNSVFKSCKKTPLCFSTLYLLSVLGRTYVYKFRRNQDYIIINCFKVMSDKCANSK